MRFRWALIPLVVLLATASAARPYGRVKQSESPVAEPCQRSELSAFFSVDPGAALGNRGGTVVIRNRSGHRCSVAGYLDLRLEDGRHRQQRTRVKRGPTYFQPDRGPHLVVLDPGARAVANVAWTSEPSLGEPLRGPCEQQSRWLAVTLASQRKPFLVRLDAIVCGHGRLFTNSLRAASKK